MDENKIKDFIASFENQLSDNTITTIEGSLQISDTCSIKFSGKRDENNLSATFEAKNLPTFENLLDFCGLKNYLDNLNEFNLKKITLESIKMNFLLDPITLSSFDFTIGLQELDLPFDFSLDPKILTTINTVSDQGSDFTSTLIGKISKNEYVFEIIGDVPLNYIRVTTKDISIDVIKNLIGDELNVPNFDIAKFGLSGISLLLNKPKKSIQFDATLPKISFSELISKMGVEIPNLPNLTNLIIPESKVTITKSEKLDFTIKPKTPDISPKQFLGVELLDFLSKLGITIPDGLSTILEINLNPLTILLKIQLGSDPIDLGDKGAQLCDLAPQIAVIIPKNKLEIGIGAKIRNLNVGANNPTELGGQIVFSPPNVKLSLQVEKEILWENPANVQNTSISLGAQSEFAAILTGAALTGINLSGDFRIQIAGSPLIKVNATMNIQPPNFEIRLELENSLQIGVLSLTSENKNKGPTLLVSTIRPQFYIEGWVHLDNFIAAGLTVNFEGTIFSGEVAGNIGDIFNFTVQTNANITDFSTADFFVKGSLNLEKINLVSVSKQIKDEMKDVIDEITDTDGKMQHKKGEFIKVIKIYLTAKLWCFDNVTGLITDLQSDPHAFDKNQNLLERILHTMLAEVMRQEQWQIRDEIMKAHHPLMHATGEYLDAIENNLNAAQHKIFEWINKNGPGNLIQIKKASIKTNVSKLGGSFDVSFEGKLMNEKDFQFTVVFDTTTGIDGLVEKFLDEIKSTIKLMP